MTPTTRRAVALVAIALCVFVSWRFLTGSSTRVEVGSGGEIGEASFDDVRPQPVSLEAPPFPAHSSASVDRDTKPPPHEPDEPCVPERGTPLGVVIEGVVYDGDGDPLPDAWVAVDAFPARDEPIRDIVQVAKLRTDSNGRYRTAPLRAVVHRLVASKPEYFTSEPVEVRLDEPAPRRNVDFQIRYAAWIHGRLVDPSGAPLRLDRPPIGALHVRGSAKTSGSAVWREGLGAVHVAQSRYQLQPDAVRIAEVGLFFRDRLLASAPVIPDQGGPDLVVDVEKLPPEAIVGSAWVIVTVLDASTRAPFTDAGVWIRSEPRGHPGESIVESIESVDETTGEILLQTVPGRHVITATAGGAAPIVRHVDLPLGQTRLAFKLLPVVAALSGRVLLSNGTPAARAVVELLGLDGRPAGISWGATCDDEGRFRIEALASDEYLVVARPRSEWRAATDGPVTKRVSVPSGGSSTELQLEAGSQVEFRIVRSDGESVRRFAISIRDASGAWIVDDDHGIDRRDDPWRLGSDPCTFVLAPGTYHYEVRSPDCLPAAGTFSSPLAAPMNLHLERSTSPSSR